MKFSLERKDYHTIPHTSLVFKSLIFILTRLFLLLRSSLRQETRQQSALIRENIV